MQAYPKTFIRKDGYRVVYQGTVNGQRVYILEHRLVIEALLGRKLKRTEIVHHKDGNKLNNSPSNLEVMTRYKHNHHHKVWETQRSRIDCTCQRCATVVSLPPNLAIRNKYCSEECRLAALHDSLRVVRPSKPCDVCGTIISRQSRYPLKYCSEACRAKGRGQSVSTARRKNKVVNIV